jgi:hypothetical protein
MDTLCTLLYVQYVQYVQYPPSVDPTMEFRTVGYFITIAAWHSHWPVLNENGDTLAPQGL